jgi:hypothetical protein
MSEKIYCGNAKEIETKFGKMLKISFSKEDLQKLNNSLNEQGWVNCNVKEKQTKVQGKPTHYLEIDTYQKPTDTRSQVSETETKADDGGLPF